ncbi:MAG: gamma-glutamylcyclotransferase [Gammaproteobacteria bacterium]
MNAERRTPQLFLYGSLLTGTPDRRLNKRMRRLLRRAPVAMIRARLYNLGRYPGVVFSTGTTDRVYGRVIGVGDPRLLLQLDRYEEYRIDDPAGSEFVRVLMPAQLLPSGKTIDCWVYVYNRRASGKQRIVRGDYIRFRNAWRNRRRHQGLEKRSNVPVPSEKRWG